MQHVGGKRLDQGYPEGAWDRIRRAWRHDGAGGGDGEPRLEPGSGTGCDHGIVHREASRRRRLLDQDFTSPALGQIEATLSGGKGDWDLAIFSSGSGDTVAGSAYSGSDEVAGGWAFEDEPLTVQVCRLPGHRNAPARRRLEPILRDRAGPAPSLIRVETPTEASRSALAGSSLDVTESVGPGYTESLPTAPATASCSPSSAFPSPPRSRI